MIKNAIQKEVLEALKIVTSNVLNRFGSDEISKVILFGSQAKGTYTPASDIDILILSKNIISKISILEYFWNLSDEMIENGYKVHLLFEKEEHYNLGCEDYYKDVPNYGYIYYASS